MESRLEQIRDKQKNSWNHFSDGWKKWDEFNMRSLKYWADEIIRLINPKEGDVILDVASGTGEPGLTIASMIGDGSVVITDLSDGMLETAREKAAEAGRMNVQVHAADVSALPFEDNSFDAISCRFGFMFFPDMQQAASELRRVLKPGGRIAVSVWSKPEHNFWVMATLNTLRQKLQLPIPPADAPGMFRCADDGFIASIFKKAGFKNIKESRITGELLPGTLDTYWSFMTEVITPVVAALADISDEMKGRLKQEVFKIITAASPNGTIALEACGMVTYGEK
ncbi:MAG TPA: class I SAM-dependent methyltransferase [Candidatus Kapabacteria bacterium]|nr:class I SAM-dependent methyltransferase [Candidatus Kapabacteria bacterium]